MKTKQELRKEILKRRDALTLEERREKSHIIAEKVIAQKEFIEADKVLLFASYKSEVDTSEIFEAAQKLRKDIYYPKVIGSEMEFFKVESERDLIEGYRGIREPEVNEEKRFRPKLEDKICVVMPGAVFDREGNRIGYGGGYYDKYLWQLMADAHVKDTECQGSGCCVKKIYKMVVAFECQMVEAGQIIREPHDIKPDYIVTEADVTKVVSMKRNR